MPVFVYFSVLLSLSLFLHHTSNNQLYQYHPKYRYIEIYVEFSKSKTLSVSHIYGMYIKILFTVKTPAGLPEVFRPASSECSSNAEGHCVRKVNVRSLASKLKKGKFNTIIYLGYGKRIL